MKEIFKQIDKWLEEAKDNQSRHTFTGPEAFHRGEVAAYTKVGVLLQRHLTSSSNRQEKACAHHWVDATNEVIKSGRICTKCYAISPAA